jgi:hypothetical protein
VIGWLLTSWPGQIAIVLFAAWFLRGLWKATMRPRVKLVSWSRLDRGKYSKSEYLVTVVRNELLPPWRTLEEAWLVGETHRGPCATRESDGRKIEQGITFPSPLALNLKGLCEVAEAREQETADLIADDPRKRPS